MEKEYSLIVAIVNRGFAGKVMDAARENGAGGGTVVNAKGTVAERAQSILGVSVQPERELVLILAEKSLRNPIMTAVVNEAGLTTKGKGIVFALPAENVLGLGKYETQTESSESQDEQTDITDAQNPDANNIV